MNACAGRILVSCCFVAAVGATVYRIGVDSGRKGEPLNLMRKVQAADDKVTDPNDKAPRPDTNYPGWSSFFAHEPDRGWEYAELIRNRRHDANDIASVWRSKLIEEQELTERDSKMRD